MIQVRVNGESREFPEGTSVAAVISTITDDARGIAVAIDSTVVPRRTWSDFTVPDGAELLVITAAQGG